MKTRKTLALLLVLVMMMGLLSFSALAAQTTSITNDGLTMQFGDPGATATGNGAAQNIPTIKYGSSQYYMPNTVAHSYMTTTSSISLSAGTYYINATTTGKIIINGNPVSSGTGAAFTVTAGNTTYVQVITQNDTNSPYITVVKFVGT